jgi:tetratricopeptide (TPR) repeat protein
MKITLANTAIYLWQHALCWRLSILAAAVLTVVAMAHLAHLVEPPGLELYNIAPTRTADGLIIEGEIANAGSTLRHVPRLRVGLRDRADKEVQFKIIDPPKPQLLPGETARFKTSFDNPDASATGVVASFVLSVRELVERGERARDDKNYVEAMRWYRMAADQGNAVAQTNIGFLYQQHGQGVSQDYAEAMRWYRMAADQGNAVAQNNIGVAYEKGQGVSQDNVEAMRWYRMAADQGNAVAQNNIGWMIAHGEGVSKDCTVAKQWLDEAAAAGNELARKKLESGAGGACKW